MIVIALAAVSIHAKDALLVFRPDGKDFGQVLKGLQSEIGNDYDIKEMLIGEGAKKEDLDSGIARVRPRLIVLMDNRILNLFKKHQAALTGTAALTPSVSVMSISLEREIKGLKKATGISYEIPIVTSAVNLRGIIGKPIAKIGIVHREYLDPFIAANAAYCKREGIEIVSVPLANKERDCGKAVKAGLENLYKAGKVDAVWVPNDNALLSVDIIKAVWLPMINKHKKPVIVGVETLVNPGLSFGTFAILPDHTELGKQLAEKVLEITDAGFEVQEGSVDQPLSVIKVLDLKQANRFLGLTKARIGNVDKVIE